MVVKGCKQLHLAVPGAELSQRANLDLKSNFERGVRASKTHARAASVEAADRIGKIQRHNNLLCSVIARKPNMRLARQAPRGVPGLEHGAALARVR